MDSFPAEYWHRTGVERHVEGKRVDAEFRFVAEARSSAEELLTSSLPLGRLSTGFGRLMLLFRTPGLVGDRHPQVSRFQ